MTITYVKRYLLGKRLDAVAAEHGFLLHVDQLHLNSTGAAMVADLVVEFTTSQDPRYAPPSCPAKNS